MVVRLAQDLIMYLIDITEGGIVRANGFNIFRLTRPFGHLFDRRKNPNVSKKLLTRCPSETMGSKQILRYSVWLDDKTVARLHCRRGSDFKCHALYKTFATYKQAVAYQLFVAKVLDYILVNLYDRTKVPEEISRYLQKLIQLVFASYQFECMYTDCKRIVSICEYLDIPVTYFEWHLIDEPGPQDLSIILEGLLNTHKKIPLNILDHRVLRNVSLDQTNIDSDIFENKKNYMFLTPMNHYFAGYFLEVCVEHFGGKEVLPVILFSI